VSVTSRIAAALAVLLAVLVPVPGQAVFHFANIDEIMSGKGGDSTAQYVEIRMLSAFQGDVAHSRLTAFSCDGSTHTILLEVPGNVCPANAGGRWTMGTTSWAGATGVTPDFIFPASVAFANGCGMICWGADNNGLSPPPNPPTWDAGVPDNYNPDCVAYGGYTGTLQTGDAAASPLAAGDGTMSLQRMDDTNNDSIDFDLAAPTPARNGACSTTTTTAVTTSSTVTTTSFPPGSGQPVAGMKLLLKANPSKPAKKALVLVAKDAGLVAGDPTQTGGSLRVSASARDGFDTSYPLPASRWKPIGKGKGYRFKDPAGPIKSVVVRPGKVAKAIGKGTGLGHTLAVNPDPVTVLLAVGAQRDCMSFAGGKFVAGKKYLATNDPPPAACP